MLIRKAKPRKKKKEIKLTTKFVFEAFSDNENEAKMAVKLFRNWIRDVFPTWNESILQHFLTQTGLRQTADGKKFLLAVNIDKILIDDASIKDERRWIDTDIANNHQTAEESIAEQEQKMLQEEQDKHDQKYKG